MKILVLHGQKHHGSTWNITKMFLDGLVKKDDTLDEFFVNDLPDCNGCFNCILRDENTCPHRDVYGPIIEAFEAADIVVVESPNYCFGMTGQLKTFFDHMAYRWIVHRPLPSMNYKLGVVFCTTAGTGAGVAARQIKRQLTWLGIPKVYTCHPGVAASCWEDVSPETKNRITKHVARLSKTVRTKQPKVRKNIKTWFLYQFTGYLQSSNMGTPVDKAYWQQQGWIK